MSHVILSADTGNKQQCCHCHKEYIPSIWTNSAMASLGLCGDCRVAFLRIDFVVPEAKPDTRGFLQRMRGD